MRVHLHGEQAQDAFGRKIASRLQSPCVIYLDGDLGTGKTTLVRGVLRGLGHTRSVRSPTYTLLEPYDLGGMRLYHLDLYRLGDPEELEFVGLRDLLDEESVLLVEWPERGAGILPPPDLVIRITYAPSGRDLHLLQRSQRGVRLVAALSEKT
ncbi:MAG: tRNA (adenosine(37)-N6)-threonylcarbamoyltransferase complex ATPase subunit type 1 TsaE [Pseudomonadota bacterium]|nr:tRNA (adenosine(37)-N6)-threonylcarbamoyltransferase complex ATPase subunit type 1 TsaE [Pseudomonadota bacterium]